MVKMSDECEYEFYIANSSCSPGGMRSHSNICLADFDEACKFAINSSPHFVLWYSWKMFVWHYKVVNDEVTLLDTFNMNDYIAGVLDKKGYFHCVDINNKDVNETKFGYPQCDQYDKVVYHEPANPGRCNSDKIKKLYKNKEVFVTLPDQTKPAKFLVGHGYHWEDAPELFDYEIDEVPQMSTPKHLSAPKFVPVTMDDFHSLHLFNLRPKLEDTHYLD